MCLLLLYICGVKPINFKDMEHKLTTENILAAAEECESAKRVLKKLFPEAFKRKNVVTQFPDKNQPLLNINGRWAACIYATEEQGKTCPANEKLNGRKASMYLANSNFRGQWYDQEGNKIGGYLFYEPNE